MANPKKPSALEFALLIDSVPKLTEEFVTSAYLAARAAWEDRDDVELERLEDSLRGNVALRREELSPVEADDVSRFLASPAEGRRIVVPALDASAGSLAVAAERFVEFAGRLPHLSTWDDRQAVWNLLPGRRAGGTPITDCAGAYERRSTTPGGRQR